METPNWVYYYNQAYPAPYDFIYVPGNSSRYLPGTTFLQIGDNAHWIGDGKSPLFETRNGKIEWVGVYQAFGLDNYARTIAHESNHKHIYDTYAVSIDAAKGDKNGINDSEKGSDGKMLDSDADPDNDGLPSGYEESLGLNPMKADSFNLIPDRVEDPNNPPVEDEDAYTETNGDGEVVARWEENKIGLAPDRMKDWANDGLNFGAAPSLNHARILRWQRNGETPLP